MSTLPEVNPTKLSEADRVAAEFVAQLQDQGITDGYTLYLAHKARWDLAAGGDRVLTLPSCES